MRVAPGAWWYAAPALLGAVPAFFVTPWATALLLGFAGFTLWFFRDPDRQVPLSGIVSPADGTVAAVREEGDRLRVGVFMGVTDVHVNRAPVGGEVGAVSHSPGANRPAFSKESERNERVRIDLGEVTVWLIAGAFARRITTYVEPGEAVERGDRIGHVAFGSRADVLLPPSVDRPQLAVERGERVRAGESVIAVPP